MGIFSLLLIGQVLVLNPQKSNDLFMPGGRLAHLANSNEFGFLSPIDHMSSSEKFASNADIRYLTTYCANPDVVCKLMTSIHS